METMKDRERQARFRENNRERLNLKQKVRYKNNRIYYMSKEHERQAAAKKAAFDYYGRLCACCGEDFPLFLTIDHINGGGSQHRREVGTGSHIYVWLKLNGYPPGFRTLCWNCQWGAARNGGVCPCPLRSKTIALSCA